MGVSKKINIGINKRKQLLLLDENKKVIPNQVSLTIDSDFDGEPTMTVTFVLTDFEKIYLDG